MRKENLPYTETELLASDPSRKDGPTPVSILYIPILYIQNNSPTYFSLLSFSYKSLFFLSTSESKKPTVKIEKIGNIDSNIKMQSLSS